MKYIFHIIKWLTHGNLVTLHGHLGQPRVGDPLDYVPSLFAAVLSASYVAM